jgi:serine/threonine protein kinase
LSQKVAPNRDAILSDGPAWSRKPFVGRGWSAPPTNLEGHLHGSLTVESLRMWFVPGTRIGPHEVVAPLGVGGMGEVLRALDTALGRQVAIKVLPDVFSHDPERLGPVRA